MKVNKKIIGLILAGGLLISTGFVVGNAQYKDYLASKENTKTEQITIETEDQNVETSKQLTEEQQKEILVNAFNKVVKKYGYDYCENSTRVITIKTYIIIFI